MEWYQRVFKKVCNKQKKITVFVRFSIVHCTAGRSGLVVALARLPAAREGPGSNRAADKKFIFTKITAKRSFGHGLHTYCSAYVDSAFHPPRDGKWVSTLWLSNNTWWWANFRPIAAYRRTQKSSLQFGLRVGGHLALTDFGPDEPQWTLAYCWRRRWQHYKYRCGYYYYYYY